MKPILSVRLSIVPSDMAVTLFPQFRFGVLLLTASIYLQVPPDLRAFGMPDLVQQPNLREHQISRGYGANSSSAGET
jgi:hypothetical protein